MGRLDSSQANRYSNEWYNTSGEGITNYVCHVKMQIFIDIYNMRISYPNERILIALADIKACFWFARIHADLTGAFGFLADDIYNVATVMVFGSTTSASS